LIPRNPTHKAGFLATQGVREMAETIQIAKAELQQLLKWLGEIEESYPYLMLFSGDPLPDVRRRSLAVEPMTCPPNAFRTGEALIRLKPGSSFTGTWGIARRK